ncbi:MAG: site-specific DNA-methyltransferase [Chloroflexi bacterium]|nr:site-specific DNA-methyltransferase [Chloroflexota bacterium]
MPRYAGRVNCIYIDPPYNTGNDTWVYKDNVNSPLLQEWLSQNSEVDGEDLERHDKWLCMMWPRLHLLSQLLADDGVIFISIDDNEQHHLRMLLDEIFGEANLVTNFTWRKRAGVQDAANKVSVDHDYVAAYAGEGVVFHGLEKTWEAYANPDNDPRGPWTRGDLTCNKTSQERPNLYYSLTDPETGIAYTCNPRRVWAYDEENMAALIAEGKVLFPADGSGSPGFKRHQSEVRSSTKTFSSIMTTDYNAIATRRLREVIPEDSFPHPKPVDLIRQLIDQVAPKDAIVLDSFAGSGTTAEASLRLNAEDGGDRRFILVECESYADTITAERVRRVIKGVPDAKDKALREGLGGSFTYCTLGEPIDSEQMLSGEALPSYANLASHLLHTAVGKSVGGGIRQPEDGEPFHAEEEADYYLLYRPDVDWLRGPDAMFTTTLADRIAERKRPAVVFAAGKYMSQRDLTPRQITFCQLPYELHRSG